VSPPHVQTLQCLRHTLILGSAVLATLALGACAPTDSTAFSPRLSAVRSRGVLLCGVNGKLPGFSFVDVSGTYRGLDVDICKAVAAATLGNPDRVDYRELNPAERFAALASGEVDLLSRNTSYSLSREARGGNNLSFAPVVFYDGQGMLVPQRSGIHRLRDLQGKTICVISGTTSELNLANSLRQQGIAYTPLKYQTADQAFASYLQGRCAAISSDRSGLAAKRSSFPDPAAHRVLNALMSKEPLAPASSKADPAWADVLRWTIYALMQAEELGISQSTIDARLAEARANPNQADLRRFLGVEGDFGRQLGLAPDFVVQVIRATGHYGEIFARNVGMGSPIGLERGLNQPWSKGGLMFSPPFR
jgi:general L-amino acid transport system substrate-binding protein